MGYITDLIIVIEMYKNNYCTEGEISHEIVCNWCHKFSDHFEEVIKKKPRKMTDKWHLDEMTIRINGEDLIL